MSTELEHIIQHAVSDLRSLRHENEILRAKVDVMDLFAAMFFAEAPRRGGMMAPDVVWKLERHLKSMEEERGVADARAKEAVYQSGRPGTVEYPDVDASPGDLIVEARGRPVRG
jgi:hypothetical protein